MQCCTFFSSPLSRCAGPGGLLSSPPGGSTFSPHSQSLLTSEGPPGASAPSQQTTGAPSSVGSGRRSAREREREDKRSVHIKKPLNAFMLYMKEMRPKIVAECTLKESAAINQILGRRVSTFFLLIPSGTATIHAVHISLLSDNINRFKSQSW